MMLYNSISISFLSCYTVVKINIIIFQHGYMLPFYFIKCSHFTDNFSDWHDPGLNHSDKKKAWYTYKIELLLRITFFFWEETLSLISWGFHLKLWYSMLSISLLSVMLSEREGTNIIFFISVHVEKFKLHFCHLFSENKYKIEFIFLDTYMWCIE